MTDRDVKSARPRDARGTYGVVTRSSTVQVCPVCARGTLGAGPAARHLKACRARPRTADRRFTAVELFAGAGGLALGVAKAGFKHLGVIEFDADACASLRHNLRGVPDMREWSVLGTDARDVDYRLWAGRVTAVTAGAPCQPFSQGGKRRGEEDERNMFPEVFRAVREIEPEVFIIENVKGLLHKNSAEYFDYIVAHLSHPAVIQGPAETWLEHRSRLHALPADAEELRYEIAVQPINAADYGLPQHRERVFIIGFRADLEVKWEPLAATHSRDALLYAQWVDGSYWREHDLARPATPANVQHRVEQLGLFGAPRLARWRTVRDALRGLPEPVNNVEADDFFNHVGIPGARAYHGHTGSPLDWPAKTLKAGAHGVPGGENMLLRANGSVRYFTIREMARLQGFPDEYVLQGAWTRAMRQLGNAVPVDIARVVASRAREILEGAREVAQVA